MLRVQVYREHAADCRRLARRAAASHIRDELLTMAESWDKLAQQREDVLVRKLTRSHALSDAIRA